MWARQAQTSGNTGLSFTCLQLSCSLCFGVLTCAPDSNKFTIELKKAVKLYPLHLAGHSGGLNIKRNIFPFLSLKKNCKTVKEQLSFWCDNFKTTSFYFWSHPSSKFPNLGWTIYQLIKGLTGARQETITEWYMESEAQINVEPLLGAPLHWGHLLPSQHITS